MTDKLLKGYWRKIRCDWRCCIGQILKECQTTPPVIKEIPEEQNQGTVKLSSVQVSDAHLALFWAITLPKFEKGFERNTPTLVKAKKVTLEQLELTQGNIDYSFL